MADSCCSNIVVVNETTSVIVAGGEQGPPGPSINPADYFQTANRFSELDTQEKKVEARQNLELQYIDCGTFN
jgi:hypothetical protein